MSDDARKGDGLSQKMARGKNMDVVATERSSLRDGVKCGGTVCRSLTRAVFPPFNPVRDYRLVGK